MVTSPTGVQKSPRIPFVSIFKDRSSEIARIVREHWNVIKHSYMDIPEFQLPPLMLYRRDRNLKDCLVKSVEARAVEPKVVFLSKPRVISFPCLSCINCKLMQKGSTFVHPRTVVVYPINHFLTSNSDWCSYILWCPCGCLYIGETTCDIKMQIFRSPSTYLILNTLNGTSNLWY